MNVGSFEKLVCTQVICSVRAPRGNTENGHLRKGRALRKGALFCLQKGQQN